VTQGVIRRTLDALGKLRYWIRWRIYGQHEGRTYHQQQAHTCYISSLWGISRTLHHVFRPYSGGPPMPIASHLWSIVQGRGVACRMDITYLPANQDLFWDWILQRKGGSPRQCAKMKQQTPDVLDQLRYLICEAFWATRENVPATPHLLHLLLMKDPPHKNQRAYFLPQQWQNNITLRNSSRNPSANALRIQVQQATRKRQHHLKISIDSALKLE